MANKTIPELPEIDLADLDPAHLLILETGLETYKLRLETLVSKLLSIANLVVGVVFDGSETGVKSVDVTDLVEDATVMLWVLKKSTGEQMNLPITTADALTVEIDTGDFALPAGTYLLLGV